jgi:hypothetical protein
MAVSKSRGVLVISGAVACLSVYAILNAQLQALEERMRAEFSLNRSSNGVRALPESSSLSEFEKRLAALERQGPASTAPGHMAEMDLKGLFPGGAASSTGPEVEENDVFNVRRPQRVQADGSVQTLSIRCIHRHMNRGLNRGVAGASASSCLRVVNICCAAVLGEWVGEA